MFYAVQGGTTFAEYGGSELTFYQNDSYKMGLYYGRDSTYSQDYATLKLGNTEQAYVMKRRKDGGDQEMWVGNEDATCGLLLNFDDKTYKLVGTNSGSSSATAVFG